MMVQLLEASIQPVITVAGWFVAGWWAIRQVNVAHSKNAVLQRELMREGHRAELAKELLEIYKAVARANQDLGQKIFTLSLNYSLERGTSGISAKALVLPVEEAYDRLSQEIAGLELWLKVVGADLSQGTDLQAAINNYQSVFSASSKTDTEAGLNWLGYQCLLVDYKRGQSMNDEDFHEVSSHLVRSLKSVLDELTNGAARVKRELTGA